MSLVTQLSATFAAIGTDIRNALARITTAENKLTGIEAGATADQTAAEIKTAYESNGNTNAFTDALSSKLNGIEAGATGDMTNAQIKTAYEANANSNAFTDAEKTKVGYVGITSAIDLNALKTTVDGMGDSVSLRGEWNVGTNSTFPSGAKKGYSYIITGSRTIDGRELNEGDRLIALKANPSTTVYATNWFHADGSDKVASVNGRAGVVTGLQEAAAIGDTNRNFTTDYTTARDA